ncbi:hypothetical protein CEUSTIGMA_g11660.t1 [Chlamydomonas eustigma]|uniref:Uncharacterized protein n=1 Tax=Chlamydomonas eustigma TaxID=1157962 RepID=A0A250XMD5_9CHLO|nr:hypothetical protein CEUSTIGMA_g11660.t1 [Chlamydomonas eustigma]|eukprot:GAX84237.1 hypothetical protein CEUSTIGMA_g11660.t1 [Chlamydomonas eustigma]
MYVSMSRKELVVPSAIVTSAVQEYFSSLEKDLWYQCDVDSCKKWFYLHKRKVHIEAVAHASNKPGTELASYVCAVFMPRWACPSCSGPVNYPEGRWLPLALRDNDMLQSSSSAPPSSAKEDNGTSSASTMEAVQPEVQPACPVFCDWCKDHGRTDCCDSTLHEVGRSAGNSWPAPVVSVPQGWQEGRQLRSTNLKSYKVFRATLLGSDKAFVIDRHQKLVEAANRYLLNSCLNGSGCTSAADPSNTASASGSGCEWPDLLVPASSTNNVGTTAPSYLPSTSAAIVDNPPLTSGIVSAVPSINAVDKGSGVAPPSSNKGSRKVPLWIATEKLERLWKDTGGHKMKAILDQALVHIHKGLAAAILVDPDDKMGILKNCDDPSQRVKIRKYARSVVADDLDAWRSSASGAAGRSGELVSRCQQLGQLTRPATPERGSYFQPWPRLTEEDMAPVFCNDQAVTFVPACQLDKGVAIRATTAGHSRRSAQMMDATREDELLNDNSLDDALYCCPDRINSTFHLTTGSSSSLQQEGQQLVPEVHEDRQTKGGIIGGLKEGLSTAAAVVGDFIRRQGAASKVLASRQHVNQQLKLMRAKKKKRSNEEQFAACHLTATSSAGGTGGLVSLDLLLSEDTSPTSHTRQAAKHAKHCSPQMNAVIKDSAGRILSSSGLPLQRNPNHYPLRPPNPGSVQCGDTTAVTTVSTKGISAVAVPKVPACRWMMSGLPEDVASCEILDLTIGDMSVDDDGDGDHGGSSREAALSPHQQLTQQPCSSTPRNDSLLPKANHLNAMQRAKREASYKAYFAVQRAFLFHKNCLALPAGFQKSNKRGFCGTGGGGASCGNGTAAVCADAAVCVGDSDLACHATVEVGGRDVAGSADVGVHCCTADGEVGGRGAAGSADGGVHCTAGEVGGSRGAAGSSADAGGVHCTAAGEVGGREAACSVDAGGVHSTAAGEVGGSDAACSADGGVHCTAGEVGGSRGADGSADGGQVLCSAIGGASSHFIADVYPGVGVGADGAGGGAGSTNGADGAGGGAGSTNGADGAGGGAGSTNGADGAGGGAGSTNGVDGGDSISSWQQDLLITLQQIPSLEASTKSRVDKDLNPYMERMQAVNSRLLRMLLSQHSQTTSSQQQVIQGNVISADKEAVVSDVGAEEVVQATVLGRAAQSANKPKRCS